jgi:hypothetical protein
VSPCGLDVGGTNVKKNFEKFFGKAFGNQLVNRCKTDYANVWLDLLNDFEIQMKKVTSEFDKPMYIRLKYTFVRYCEEFSGNKINQLISQSKCDGITYNNKTGKIKIHEDILKSFFWTEITRIVEHLSTLFMDPEIRDVTTICVVGEFGQCPPLFEAIKKQFGANKNVLLPDDATTSVVQGAVLFGFNENFVQSSKALNKTN